MSDDDFSKVSGFLRIFSKLGLKYENQSKPKCTKVLIYDINTGISVIWLS